MNALKRALFVISIAIVFFCPVLAAAAPRAVAADKTVTVFAAASMTESMNRIAELYKAVAPDIKIVYNFDSSGTLKTQIEQGADCDIFISAGQKQMDQIEPNFILSNTRLNLVSNKVVLIVPKGGNPNKINNFKDVVTDKVSLVALGNSDVPVGQYSQEIFTNLGIWEKLTEMNRISFAGNVKEVLAQVAAGAVDCGVVYSTDAATSKGVDVAAEAPKNSHKPIAYPVAIIKGSRQEASAKNFVVFLKSDAATSVLKSVGFTIPKR